MIDQLSTAVGVAAGLGLTGIGAFMLFMPRRALGVLAAMGGTPLIHFGEMAVRGLIGGALIVAGPSSRFSVVLPLIGGFLVVSALILALLPRRWHSAYSRWWADRIPPWAFRVSGAFGMAAGAVLVWAFV